MRLVIAIVLLSLGLHGSPARAQELSLSAGQLRPVHTYSIVARDPATGEMGVAVQSHWFSVGPLVAWAEAGVGAVATQSFIDVRYGASGLDLMRSGWTPRQALQALVKADPHPEVRQVAMIDASGEVAVHTGERCIRYAGHRTGDSFSVQANLMLNDGVWVAMAEAYRGARGSLAKRMLAALEAAQATGGDARGKQSAAVLVVRGESTGKPWADRLVDLRIDDHAEPIRELRRLLTLHTAYEHMNRGDLAIEQGNVEGALAEYGEAETLVPGNAEMKFWHAVSLVNAGRIAAALPLFEQVFKTNDNWRLLVPRLAAAQLLPQDDAIVERILSVAAATE